MQYELYSIEKCDNKDLFFHRLSTDDVTTVFFYINQVDNNKKYIIIDNYGKSPLNYSMLGLKKSLNETEYKTMLLECKLTKYIDIFIDQKYNIDEICVLSLSAAKKETDFLLKLFEKN